MSAISRAVRRYRGTQACRRFAACAALLCAILALLLRPTPLGAEAKNMYECPGGCKDVFHCFAGNNQCKCGCGNADQMLDCARAKEILLSDADSVWHHTGIASVDRDFEGQIRRMPCGTAIGFAQAIVDNHKRAAENQRRAEEQKAENDRRIADQKARNDQFWTDQKAKNDQFRADQRARNERIASDPRSANDANRQRSIQQSSASAKHGPGPSPEAPPAPKDFAAELEDGAKGMAVDKAREAFEDKTGLTTHVPGEDLADRAKEYVDDAQDRASGLNPLASRASEGIANIGDRIMGELRRADSAPAGDSSYSPSRPQAPSFDPAELENQAIEYARSDSPGVQTRAPAGDAVNDLFGAPGAPKPKAAPADDANRAPDPAASAARDIAGELFGSPSPASARPSPPPDATPSQQPQPQPGPPPQPKPDPPIAYDPGPGGMSIGPSSLRPGDAILIGSSFSASAPGATGKAVAIQDALGQPVEHAMIVEQVSPDGKNVTVIEAVGGGVKRDVVLSDALSQSTQAVVFRDPSLSDAQRAKLVDFAAGKVGQPYDYAGARGLVTGERGSKDKFFCSDLVVQTYQQVGHYTWANSKSVSPGDIAESHALQYAGHLIAGTRYVKPDQPDSTRQLQDEILGPGDAGPGN